MAATDAQYPSAAADQVALLKASGFTQVASKARPMKATVKETAKAMEHPVEDGATITDHRIIQPVEIDLSLILSGADYRDTYQELKTLFTDAELLIVQTRTDNYADMIITDLPHDETPDMTDAVAVALRLRQVKTVKAVYGSLPPRAVSRPADASTTKRGEVSPQTATSEQDKKAKKSMFAGGADLITGRK